MNLEGHGGERNGGFGQSYVASVGVEREGGLTAFAYPDSVEEGRQLLVVSPVVDLRVRQEGVVLVVEMLVHRASDEIVADGASRSQSDLDCVGREQKLVTREKHVPCSVGRSSSSRGAFEFMVVSGVHSFWDDSWPVKRTLLAGETGGARETTAMATRREASSAPALMEEIVPVQFGLIVPLLYRAGPLTSQHIPHLRSLHLRTIIALSPPTSSRITLWADSQAITLVHLYHQLQPEHIEPHLVQLALERLLDRTLYPVLLVDHTGFNQVGVVVGCLRRLQGWILSAALAEVRSVSLTLYER